MNPSTYLPLILLASVSPLAAQSHTEPAAETISGHATQEWSLSLSSGERTHLVVEAGGAADLDAFLLDPSGRVLDADEAFSGFCVLDVNPERDGLYTLRVVNRSMTAEVYDVRVSTAPEGLVSRLVTGVRGFARRLLHMASYRQVLVARVATGFWIPGEAQRIPLALEALVELSRTLPKPREEAPILSLKGALAACPAFAAGSCAVSFE